MANISVSFIFFGFPIPFFFHFVVGVPPFLLLFLSSRRTWTAWSNKDSDGQFFFLWGGRSFFQSLHFQPSDTLCVQGGPIISHPATTNFSNLCLSSFGRVCISFSVQVKARCPDFSLFSHFFHEFFLVHPTLGRLLCFAFSSFEFRGLCGSLGQ